MSIEEKKAKLEKMKKEIRKRYDAGESSDDLVEKVVESTRLAREISEDIMGGVICANSSNK